MMFSPFKVFTSIDYRVYSRIDIDKHLCPYGWRSHSFFKNHLYNWFSNHTKIWSICLTPQFILKDTAVAVVGKVGTWVIALYAPLSTTQSTQVGSMFRMVLQRKLLLCPHHWETGGKADFEGDNHNTFSDNEYSSKKINKHHASPPQPILLTVWLGSLTVLQLNA